MNLFEPDNHFSDKSKIKNTDNLFESNFLPILEKKYPTLPVNQELFIFEGNFVNSINLKYDCYFIKLIAHHKIDKHNIENFPLIANTLNKSGIPVSQFYKNADMNYIVDSVYIGDEGPFYLYVQEFKSGNFYSGRKEETENLFSFLTDIQNLKIPSTPYSVNPYKSWKPEKIFDDAVDIIINKNGKDSFDSIVEENLSKLESINNYIFPLLDEIKHFEGFLSHYDLHPHNLLFESNNLVLLMDLESFVIVDPKISNAFCIFKNIRKSISKNIMNLNAARKLMKLNNIDLDQIYTFGIIEIFRRITLILDLHYTKEDFSWDIDLKKQINSIYELELICKGVNS